MGFKSLLEQQVGNVFSILGQVDGLAPNQTFVHNDGQTYDTVTRTYTTAETSYPDIPMVLARLTTDEVDSSDISSTDMKALIPAIKLPVEPSIGDSIVADGRNYEVIRNMGVPGESLYILHVREVE